MPPASVSDAALILYDLPAGEFVKARTAMEKELRTAGERELAGRIKALRKPSVIAASLNAIVRANPAAVEELLAAVADLREAQEQLVSDRKPDFARLQGEYRRSIQALADLVDESRRIETQAALEAAAIDASLYELLRTGTFADAPKPTGSFGVPIPSTGSSTRKSQSKKAQSGQSQSKKAQSGQAQSKKPDAATSTPNLRLVRAATTKVEAAKDRQTAAERALTDARETLRDLDEQTAALEAELASAQSRRRRAGDAVRAAEKALSRSAAQMAKAEEALRKSASS